MGNAFRSAFYRFRIGAFKNTFISDIILRFLELKYFLHGFKYFRCKYFYITLLLLLLLLLLLFIFTQDSLFSAYCAVINEGPAIEILIIFKAPIWATEFTPLNQTTPKESPSVRIPRRFGHTSFGKFRL